MRYRAMDANGDYQFGRSAGVMLTNSSAAVAQAVLTRLRLWTGEWFLDTTEGTPYFPDILGHNTAGTRDVAIKQRVLDTLGVQSIVSYASSINGRDFSVSMLLDTAYGQATISFSS